MSRKKQETCIYSKEQYRQMKLLHNLGFHYREIIVRVGVNMTQMMRFLEKEKEKKR